MTFGEIYSNQVDYFLTECTSCFVERATPLDMASPIRQSLGQSSQKIAQEEFSESG